MCQWWWASSSPSSCIPSEPVFHSTSWKSSSNHRFLFRYAWRNSSLGRFRSRDFIGRGVVRQRDYDRGVFTTIRQHLRAFLAQTSVISKAFENLKSRFWKSKLKEMRIEHEIFGCRIRSTFFLMNASNRYGKPTSRNLPPSISFSPSSNSLINISSSSPGLSTLALERLCPVLLRLISSSCGLVGLPSSSTGASLIAGW